MLPLIIDPMPIPNQVINLVDNRPPITPASAGFEVKNNQWLSSSFQTGNASNVYILSSATLRFGRFTSGSLFLKLYSDGNGSPNTEIMNFNVPSIGSTNNYEFTLTSPQLLTANTTYWLVAGVSNDSGRYFWAKTDSTVETGVTGWSIGNQAIFSNDQGALNIWGVLSGSGPFQFSINGQSYSPVAGDSYFSNVVLFLKGNGENNSTNIIDSSSNPKSITVIGNTRISTDQSRFDNSSIVFNGGDRLSVSNNDFAFGSGDFTIEAWVRPTGSGVAFGRVIQCGNFGSGGDWQLVRDASGGTTFGYWFDINGGSTRLISSETVNSNEWHFITIVRENSTVKMAINGAVVATGTSSQNLTRTTIAIGASEGGGQSNPMFLDELRITKGIAREITLPTAPFPDL